METLTRQQVFDHCVLHLAEQKEPSTGPDGNCAYRGQEGKACLIGSFMPDELYKENFEMMGVQCLGTGPILTNSKDEIKTYGDFRKACKAGGLSDNMDEVDFYKLLQIVHDKAASAYIEPYDSNIFPGFQITAEEMDCSTGTFWYQQLTKVAEWFGLDTTTLKSVKHVYETF